VAVFPRPLHHPDSPHKVRLLLGADGNLGDQDDAVVVGRTTFSRDILAVCRLPRNAEVGDILVFEDAGAYCWSMASRFLGQPEPATVCLGQDWPSI
jgi:diaminopimelate decarboxylase